MVRSRSTGIVGLVLVGSLLSQARGDEFDRLEGKRLAEAVAGKDASAHAVLTIGEIDALPTILRESRSAFLIVRTGQGNLAKLLVSPALRKSASGATPTLPVLVLERFDVFENGNDANRLAHGKDTILFAGFEFDLESGQVVPEGQGGDLRFESQGTGGPRLVALGESKLYSLKHPFKSEVGDQSRPSLGRSVLPGDFNGRFRLFANGQWSGWLELKVDEAGGVAGRFRSDLNGTSYSVSGQVGPDVPHRIRFNVAYPRTKQEYEGLLWTEGKGALAGTLTMLDRAYGFFAIREGGAFAPEGTDVGPLAQGESKPGRRTVTVRKGLFTLEGKARTDEELIDALKVVMAAEPATWVLLQVDDNEPFAAIHHAFEVLGAAGISTVRLAPADPNP